MTLEFEKGCKWIRQQLCLSRIELVVRRERQGKAFSACSVWLRKARENNGELEDADAKSARALVHVL